jgi:hypothetical protein
MITIYKDKDVKKVTKGAYNTFYKPLGYNVVIEAVTEEPKKSEVIDLKQNTSKKNTRVSSNNKNKKEV